MKKSAGFLNRDNIAFGNPHQLKIFLNWYRTQYSWWLRDASKPCLRFVRENREWIEFVPSDKGVTDFGSVPPLFWCVPGFSPTRFPWATMGHDQMYHTGLVRSSVDCGITWNLVEITREFADNLLAEMIGYEDPAGNALEQYIYLNAVRYGGASNWKKQSERRTKKRRTKER